MKKVGAIAAVLLAFVALPLLEPDPLSSIPQLENRQLISPGRPALALASAEHGLALSDLAWLEAVQRLGNAGFNSTRGWEEWLYSRLDIATDFDPHYLTVYDAGSVYLSAYGSAADLSDRLVSKGAKYLPRDWKLPFMMGWNDYFIRGRAADAADHWRTAAQLPEAPFYLGSLSGRALRQGTGDIDASLRFLEGMLGTIKDTRQREMIEQRMQILESERIFLSYDRACASYREDHGSWPASASVLFMTGQVAQPPQDLLGSPIHLDTTGEGCVARSELIKVREDEAIERLGRFRSSASMTSGRAKKEMSD